MKLYTNPLSPNCRKADFVIRHLGLDVERHAVDLSDADALGALRDHNPNAMVPVLIDGETTLWESNAIMPYLCGKVGETSL